MTPVIVLTVLITLYVVVAVWAFYAVLMYLGSWWRAFLIGTLWLPFGILVLCISGVEWVRYKWEVRKRD